MLILLFLLAFFMLIWFVVSYILYYIFYFYDIRSDGVVIKKGVIARREITIPYDKIQNVFIDQDFWDRILGLYDIHIATADVQSALMAHIDGVSGEHSEKLKTLILEKTQQVKNNSTP